MPFIILDRDGVINFDSLEYIKSPAEWHPIPGSLEAISRLNKAGYRVIIATNQSGLARGYYTEEVLNNIHKKLHAALAQVGGKVDEIFYCPHHPDDNCDCRKPKPGLLQQIQKKYDLNLADTFFIGDSVGDIRAALEVGCQPVLVLTGNGKKTLETYPDVLHFADLAEAVDKILCRN